MRRIELTWDDGAWSGDIAEVIVEELIHALTNPAFTKHPWVRPDSVRVVAETGLIYRPPDPRRPERSDGTTPRRIKH